MTREKSDVRDDFQIYFQLHRHGWSDIYIFLGNDVLRMGVSDVYTQASGALLKIAQAVIDNISLRVALCDEPGGHVLEVRADRKLPHTMILAVYEVFPDILFDADTNGVKKLEFKFKRRQFLTSIVTELWKTEAFLKEPSYQKGRAAFVNESTGLFPHDELQVLNAKWDCDPELGPSILK